MPRALCTVLWLGALGYVPMARRQDETCGARRTREKKEGSVARVQVPFPRGGTQPQTTPTRLQTRPRQPLAGLHARRRARPAATPLARPRCCGRPPEAQPSCPPRAQADAPPGPRQMRSPGPGMPKHALTQPRCAPRAQACPRQARDAAQTRFIRAADTPRTCPRHSPDAPQTGSGQAPSPLPTRPTHATQRGCRPAPEAQERSRRREVLTVPHGKVRICVVSRGVQGGDPSRRRGVLTGRRQLAGVPRLLGGVARRPPRNSRNRVTVADPVPSGTAELQGSS